MLMLMTMTVEVEVVNAVQVYKNGLKSKYIFSFFNSHLLDVFSRSNSNNTKTKYYFPRK